MGTSESKCDIHRGLLVQRAGKLISPTQKLDSISVEADGRTLHMFSNWVYSGRIRFIVHDGIDQCPNPKVCTLHSDIFESYCDVALDTAQNDRHGDLLIYCCRKYNDQLKSLLKCPTRYSKLYIDAAQYHMDQLVELFCFAAKYQINDLQDDTIQALAVAIKVSGHLPNFNIIEKEFSGQPFPRLLCKFLGEVYAMNWPDATDTRLQEEEARKLHPRFVSEIMRTLADDLEETKLQAQLLAIEKDSRRKGLQRKRQRQESNWQIPES